MRKVSIRFTGKPLQASSMLHVRGNTLTDEVGHDIARSLASNCAIFFPPHRLPQHSIRVDTRHLSPDNRGATPTPVLFHTTLLLPRATAIVDCRISLHTVEVGM